MGRMKHFFDSGRFKLLLIVGAFLLGLMAYAAMNSRLTAAPQELLTVAVEPFQKAAAIVSGRVVETIESCTRIDEIASENQALREENARLKNQLVDYDRLLAENTAYQQLAKIQAQNPSLSYLSAFVIGRDSLDEFGGFTLDKGTLDGVAQGDTVISDEGYLVGTVLDAGLTSSKILTLLHPSFHAAGVVSRTRENGILTGNSAYASQGMNTFTNLSRDTEAEEGDLIITTGLGGVYPPDILVGAVDRLQPEQSGKSMVALVRPGVDVRTVRHVVIITDF